jgi:hypothetical protein
MKDVPKFCTRRCTRLKLMAIYCFWLMLDPADISVPTMMLCDDIITHMPTLLPTC